MHIEDDITMGTIAAMDSTTASEMGSTPGIEEAMHGHSKRCPAGRRFTDRGGPAQHGLSEFGTDRVA